MLVIIAFLAPGFLELQVSRSIKIVLKCWDGQARFLNVVGEQLGSNGNAKELFSVNFDGGHW